MNWLKYPIKAASMLCLWCILLSFDLCADQRESRLISAGLELFPSFVAADIDLNLKKNIDGHLPLLLVFKNDGASAASMAEELQKIEKIHGIPIVVKSIHTSNFVNMEQTVVAVFLTEQLGEDLNETIDYSIQKRILLFSPFSQDIFQGAMASISVKDRILPYVNMTTLTKTRIRIKPFFLRISKQHYDE